MAFTVKLFINGESVDGAASHWLFRTIPPEAQFVRLRKQQRNRVKRLCRPPGKLDIFYCLNIQIKSTTVSFDNLLENLEKTMTSIIKCVATGPELSKSISYEESRVGMRLVLEGQQIQSRRQCF